jgi:hypothetical protein
VLLAVNVAVVKNLRRTLLSIRALTDVRFKRTNIKTQGDRMPLKAGWKSGHQSERLIGFEFNSGSSNPWVLELYT